MSLTNYLDEIILIDVVDEVDTSHVFANINQDSEPQFDEKRVEHYLHTLEEESNDLGDYDYISNFFTTEPPPEYIDKYNNAQQIKKIQDREKINYESVSTSEDAEIDNVGNTEIILKEQKKLCQWSTKNELWHILYGKKGVMDISATFKGINDNPLVDEYLVRAVLIRANIEHRQYPVECVCEQHKGHPEGPRRDIEQVLQAKPGSSREKFWYTYDGLRKSVIFEAPRPDQDGNIEVHMNLVCLCCDSCEAASPYYQALINSAGREASRDWLLVVTLERRVNGQMEVLGRRSLPCWFKAAVSARDLEKSCKRKVKGGGSQKASCKMRKAENSVSETFGKKLCIVKPELRKNLLSPPTEGKKVLAKPQDLTIAASVLPHSTSATHPVVNLDWKFHAAILREHLSSGNITQNSLLEELFGHCSPGVKKNMIAVTEAPESKNIDNINKKQLTFEQRRTFVEVILDELLLRVVKVSLQSSPKQHQQITKSLASKQGDVDKIFDEDEGIGSISDRSSKEEEIETSLASQQSTAQENKEISFYMDEKVIEKQNFQSTETLSQTLGYQTKELVSYIKENRGKGKSTGQPINPAFSLTQTSLTRFDNVNIIEQLDNITKANEFKTVTSDSNNIITFSLGNMKIFTKTTLKVRIRNCPPDEYDDFADGLQTNESLFPASPIFQIEDFESVLSSCDKILIRHNVYDWKAKKNWFLRSYRDLTDTSSYIDIKAEMFEDYIQVCGQSSGSNGGKNNTGSESSTGSQQQIGDRNGRRSTDEGYEHNDGSPTPTTRSPVLVARSEELCYIKLYFSRQKHDSCPVAHDVSVHAVLDKKAKCKEFLEEEIDECRREQAAYRIRVPIFHDQEYTPLIGENTLENQTMSWEETPSFCKFSYNMLNKHRGYVALEKIPPELQLFCDRRKFSMVKLLTSDEGKPPESPIFDHGASIKPIYCAHNLENSTPPIQFFVVDNDQSAGSQNENPSILQTSQNVSDDLSSGDEQKIGKTNQPVQEPPRKRRKADEIQEHRCPHCQKSLARPQTLRDHIKKFHPQTSPLTKTKVADNDSVEKIASESESISEVPQPSTSREQSDKNEKTKSLISNTFAQDQAQDGPFMDMSMQIPSTVQYCVCTFCKGPFMPNNSNCEKCGKSFCNNCLIVTKCFECTAFT